MNGIALKEDECFKMQETYNVEKDMVSEMVVLLNHIEYDRKADVLCRKKENEGYRVRLHFQENNTDVLSSLQKVLKERYIELNHNQRIGETDK